MWLADLPVFKKALLALAALCVADVVMGMSVNLFHGVGVFSEKSGAIIASDFAFVEGAALLFIGSLIAFFSHGFGLREKLTVAIGAIMIGISLVFSIFA
jgi:hypothetical protein